MTPDSRTDTGNASAGRKKPMLIAVLAIVVITAIIGAVVGRGSARAAPRSTVRRAATVSAPSSTT